LLCCDSDGNRVTEAELVNLDEICTTSQGDHVLSVSTMSSMILVVTKQQFENAATLATLPSQAWTVTIHELSETLQTMYEMTNADIQLVNRDVNYHRAFEVHWLKRGFLWGDSDNDNSQKPAHDHSME
jgi:hypothetical protein